MDTIAEPRQDGSNNAPISGTDTLTAETGGFAGATGEAEQDSIANPNPAQEVEKWPGWPGHCVFRLIVPVTKVGSIIGRKGELIKKLCEETRARVRILDGALGTSDRIVLISGKEEPEAPLSPAMIAVLRVFKRVNALPDTDAEGDLSGPAGAAPCSSRLIVASSQAVNLIGKQGSVIKSMQESSGASIRVLSADETPSYVAADEKIVDIQGEVFKVVKALEAVVGHLRKFLVDPSIIPLFEKINNSSVSQDRQIEAWPDNSSLASSQTELNADFPFAFKREALFLDHENHLESRFAAPSVLSAFGQESGLSSLRSLGIGRAPAPVVTQVAQTMQIPLLYAEDIIGTAGSNIAYIRRSSGATITVQESRGLPDEITVEIKGTSSQVQAAQQLIQEFINNHKESFTNSYEKIDSGYRMSYGQLSGNTNYTSSSLPSQQPYGGSSYGSSGGGGGVGGGGGGGGYTSYRL